MVESRTVSGRADRRSLLIAACGLGLPVLGARAGIPVSLSYDVRVSGITLARAGFLAEDHGGTIDTRLTVRSAGLGSLLGGSEYMFSATSALAGDGVSPVLFDWRQVKRDRTREVAIRYVGGEIASFSYLNQGRRAETEVPPALRAGTVDPLTAVLALRDWLPDAVAGRTASPFMRAVFDGRKRFDLDATYLGKTSFAARGPAQPVYELRARMVARHGFDAGDPLVTFPGEIDGRWLRVLVAAEEDLVPVYMETRNTRVSTTITLAEA